MKRYLLLWFTVVMMLVFVPAAVFRLYSEKPAKEYNSRFSGHDDDVISVYIADEDRVENMSFRDYLTGTVAAEMPAVYEFNALCAQALCSKTLALYLALHNAPDDSLKGAIVSTDPAKHQAYMSEKTMKEKWGDDYDAYHEKICKAVDEVRDKIITYENEPVMAAFHAISPGRTEAAENVWQAPVPYLISVDSLSDRSAPTYSSSLTVNEEEFCEKIGIKNKKKNLIGETKKSEAGTVLSVKIGKKTLTGLEIRRLFGLRSAVFDITYEDGKYTFDVRGYGHGVGMSQYGADRLAADGYDWREIIEHYYPGTEITKLQLSAISL